MEKLIKIFLFFILFLSEFFIQNLPVGAESLFEKYSSGNVDLGTIAVTPTRTLTSGDRIAENFAVYTKPYIEKVPAHNLGEFLSYTPGVDVQVNNGFGQPTALSIQGSASRQVLLMVDDIPFNTQLSGQADPSIIPLENVKRVEVIRGASSSAWGSSLGGVVNVLTKDVGDSAIPKGTATSSFAEFHTQKNSLDLAGKMADLGYFFSGSHMESDGIRRFSGDNESKFFGKLGHSLALGDEAAVEGSFGYSGVKVQDGVLFGSSIYSTPSYARYGKLKLDVKNPGMDFSIAGKYNDQDIRTQIFDATSRDLTSSTISSNVYNGLSLNGNMPFRERDIFVFGTDFDWNTFKSNHYLSASKVSSTQAPYANYTFRWDDWDFVPGARYDHNNQFGSQLSPSWGMIYHFKDYEQTSWRFKVSRAFNAPPLMWVYNNDPAFLVAPNPGLKAERAMVYETGFTTRVMTRVGVDLNLYRSEVKDAIAVALNQDGLYSSQNFRKFRRQGAELGIKYKISDELNFHVSGAFNDVLNRETKMIVRDQGIARESFRIGPAYEGKNGFCLNLYSRYDRWTSSPDLEPNDRKFLINAEIAQKIKDVRKGLDLELFLNIYNMANSKYWSNITFPLPKRYFEGGFKLAF